MRRAISAAVLFLLGACGTSHRQADEPTAPTAVADATTANSASSAYPNSVSGTDREVARMLGYRVTPRQSGPMAPRDDCGKPDGADAFRKRMADALVRKDAAAFAALADENVKLGFGGDDGRARLQAKLTGGNQEYFAELYKTMSLGCAIDERGAIIMPWHFAHGRDVDDPYMSMLVTGENVPVHGAAKPDGKPLETISWDVVTLANGLKPTDDFQQIGTRDGKRGYIATEQLLSLLGTRILAERGPKGWRITAIVAGD